PGDVDQHGLLGAQDEPGRGVDAVVVDDQVDALGGTHMELAALAHHALGVVGPHTGGVDHLLGTDLVLPAALEVLDPGADDPFTLTEEAGDPRVVGGLRAVGGGGAHQGGHEAGVVHPRVVVLECADQRVLLQAGRHAQGVTTGQVPVHGQTPAVPPGHGHGV